MTETLRTVWSLVSPLPLAGVLRSLAAAGQLPVFALHHGDAVDTATTEDEGLRVVVRRGVEPGALHALAPSDHTAMADTGVEVTLLIDGPRTAARFDRLARAVEKLANETVIVGGARSVFNAAATQPQIETAAATPMSSSLLDQLLSLPGAIGAAVVDYQTGVVLDLRGGGGFDIALAARGNLEVVRQKLQLLRRLRLDEQIEDIVVTLRTQVHVIRPLQSATTYIYFAGARHLVDMAQLRHHLDAGVRQMRVIPLT